MFCLTLCGCSWWSAVPEESKGPHLKAGAAEAPEHVALGSVQAGHRGDVDDVAAPALRGTSSRVSRIAQQVQLRHFVQGSPVGCCSTCVVR